MAQRTVSKSANSESRPRRKSMRKKMMHLARRGNVNVKRLLGGQLTKIGGKASVKVPLDMQQMQVPACKYKYYLTNASQCTCLSSFGHSLHRYPKLISRVTQGSKDHNRGKDAEFRDVKGSHYDVKLQCKVSGK